MIVSAILIAAATSHEDAPAGRPATCALLDCRRRGHAGSGHTREYLKLRLRTLAQILRGGQGQAQQPATKPTSRRSTWVAATKPADLLLGGLGSEDESESSANSTAPLPSPGKPRSRFSTPASSSSDGCCLLGNHTHFLGINTHATSSVARARVQTPTRMLTCRWVGQTGAGDGRLRFPWKCPDPTTGGGRRLGPWPTRASRGARPPR